MLDIFTIKQWIFILIFSNWLFIWLSIRGIKKEVFVVISLLRKLRKLLEGFNGA